MPMLDRIQFRRSVPSASDPVLAHDAADRELDHGIGIAVAPNDGLEPDKLLKNADLALYRAKSEGRGWYCFYEHEMDVRIRTRRALELDMRKALTDGE